MYVCTVIPFDWVSCNRPDRDARRRLVYRLELLTNPLQFCVNMHMPVGGWTMTFNVWQAFFPHLLYKQSKMTWPMRGGLTIHLWVHQSTNHMKTQDNYSMLVLTKSLVWKNAKGILWSLQTFSHVRFMLFNWYNSSWWQCQAKTKRSLSIYLTTTVHCT